MARRKNWLVILTDETPAYPTSSIMVDVASYHAFATEPAARRFGDRELRNGAKFYSLLHKIDEVHA